MTSAKHFLRKGHGGMACVFGAVFLILAISGGALLCTLPAHENITNPIDKRLPLDQIHANLQKTYPTLYGPWTLELPYTKNHDLTGWHAQSNALNGEPRPPLVVTVNSATGEITGEYERGRTVTTWLHELHTGLLIGPSGNKLVGLTGIGTLLILISGVLSWYQDEPQRHAPRKTGDCKKASTICAISHHRIGILCFPILTFIAITGILLSFPNSIDKIEPSSTRAHDSFAAEVRSTAIPSDRPISIEEAILLARGPFPHALVRRINMPSGENGTFKVELCQRTEKDCLHPKTAVWIDRYSGQIRDVENPGKYSWGQQFSSNLSYYHSGLGLSPVWRIAWLLASIAPILLFASGVFQLAARRNWVEDPHLNLATAIIRSKKYAFFTTQNISSVTRRTATQGIHLTCRAATAIKSWIQSHLDD